MGQQFLAADAAGTQYALNGSFDSTGQTFTAANTLVPGTIVGTVVAPGQPVSRSVQMPTGLAQPVWPANPARKSISFQVPASATQGLWISWTGAASPNANDSFFFPAGTQFVSLDVSVTGQGAITAYAAVGSFYLPATEC